MSDIDSSRFEVKSIQQTAADKKKDVDSISEEDLDEPDEIDDE